MSCFTTDEGVCANGRTMTALENGSTSPVSAWRCRPLDGGSAQIASRTLDLAWEERGLAVVPRGENRPVGAKSDELRVRSGSPGTKARQCDLHCERRVHDGCMMTFCSCELLCAPESLLLAACQLLVCRADQTASAREVVLFIIPCCARSQSERHRAGP